MGVGDWGDGGVVDCSEYNYGDCSDIYVSNDSRKNSYFNIFNDDENNNNNNNNNNCAFAYTC